MIIDKFIKEVLKILTAILLIVCIVLPFFNQLWATILLLWLAHVVRSFNN